MGRIITVIIIIALIIGAFYLFRSTPSTQTGTPGNGENSEYNSGTSTPNRTGTTTSTTTTSSAASKRVNVSYTNNGFSPKTITIKKGDTVTFTNQSAEGMWVASNPHPTHTDYPGFDEKASVANGGSWSFTFEKVGTWGYHNHRDTANMATVVVQ